MTTTVKYQTGNDPALYSPRKSRHRLHLLPLLLAALLAVGCQSSAPAEEFPSASITSGQMAPLLDGLGNHTMPISTEEPRAQRFFDQGLVLAYGFNHAEAARSFHAAQRLDADCAICY